MKKIVIALFLIFMSISIISFSYIPKGNSENTTIAQSVHHPLFLSNITVSSDIPFNQDPSYYSFEAYHIVPPNETPVVVHVATNLLFNDTGLAPFYLKVNIPKGNYSLELMNVSIREFNGTQYDRQAYIFVNGVPIFWGSTQEINNSTAEVDVTMFENLLQGNVTFEPVIQNYYDAKIGITGLYQLNITLYLYPGPKPEGLPNEFVPLFVNCTTEKIDYNYSYVILSPSLSSITRSYVIPNGTYRMDALIWEEGGGVDEFWYANEPATRSILMYYNGKLASVINPYETIYTGGINLFYWKPLTSINTLSFHAPYIAELTPLLALGNQANITVTVTNMIPGSAWDIAGVLMLWVNQSNPLISGHLIIQKTNFMDSGPMYIPSYLGEYYLENGHYTIQYDSQLNFKYGTEISNVSQSGTFIARQEFNNVFEYAYLDESFTDKALDTGIYNASLDIHGNYPITMYLDAIAFPITNPNVIPYNLTYEQNGTISLGLTYNFDWIYGNYSHEVNVNESLYSIGGFSGILEIINRYGGAVLVSISSNNAETFKNLKATWLVDGSGFTEKFSAGALQNSTVNFNGYYIYIKESFTKIDPPITHSMSRNTNTEQSLLINNLPISKLKIHDIYHYKLYTIMRAPLGYFVRF
ncbi:peptide-N4-asparagine amidase [Acidianus manzaensis]|uniref:Glycopeptidase n=1 Tax=Acidianus manzaensis TaxID=282676 RepID=A0A1W6JX59_9CREN|nr:peptide-N4-asparagine amidase [Acidianus manzaensis]ARM74866.1 glycopeptidase [Acidianus manzaensis]